MAGNRLLSGPSLALSLALIWPQAVMAQAGTELPVVGSDCMMAPLSPQQLTALEKSSFSALAAGSPEASKFLYTRGYLRFARLVVSGNLPPLQLPCLPARSNWDRTYLTEDEAHNVVDVALGMKMLARLDGRK